MEWVRPTDCTTTYANSGKRTITLAIFAHLSHLLSLSFSLSFLHAQHTPTTHTQHTTHNVYNAQQQRTALTHSLTLRLCPSLQADILVSELLGSFGDNELSPECLDGAQKFLRFPHGVSIPYEYTSWVAPVSSSKLWNDVKGTFSNFSVFSVVTLYYTCTD